MADPIGLTTFVLGLIDRAIKLLGWLSKKLGGKASGSPSSTISFVPQRHWWGGGSVANEPAMQVVSDWWMTNDELADGVENVSQLVPSGLYASLMPESCPGCSFTVSKLFRFRLHWRLNNAQVNQDRRLPHGIGAFRSSPRTAAELLAGRSGSCSKYSVSVGHVVPNRRQDHCCRIRW